MGQGISLALSGLNNTLAIHSNMDWVWACWAELQRDPASPFFIPTGANLITSNLTLRNWTSLGVPGSDREGMVDPVGMVTPAPYSWSAFPYLQVGGVRLVPPLLHGQVRQERISDSCPGVRTLYPEVRGIVWTSECMAASDDEAEWLLWRHRIRNDSDHPQLVDFGLTLRPYNSLTQGHIHRLRFQRSLWRVNRSPALLTATTPDLSWVSASDVLLRQPDRSAPGPVHSRDGMLTAASLWRLGIGAGEERIIETPVILARHPHCKRLRTAEDSAQSLERSVHFRTLWDAGEAKAEALRAQGLQLMLPNAEDQQLFEISKARFHVFDDSVGFTPGTYVYHEEWIRDSWFLGRCALQLGRWRRVWDKVPSILARQRRNGYFRYQNGEWDSNGQALSLVSLMWNYAGKPELPAPWLRGLVKGGRWIEEFRKEAGIQEGVHRGLLPAGFSAEHFGSCNHYYWDNLWSLQGLRSLMELSAHQAPEELDRIGGWAEGLGADLDRSMAHAAGEWGGILPGSPFRTPDASCIGNVMASSTLGLVGRDAAWLIPTLEYLWEEHVRDGLFFQRIFHSGLNAYLSAQLAQAFLLLQDGRWRIILEALKRYASPTGCWPEAIHPVTRGGCMGDGDHGWALAEVVALLRGSLVFEYQGRLLLGLGLEASLGAGSVGVENAATSFGTIDWKLTTVPGPEGSWVRSLEWKFRGEPTPLLFCMTGEQGLGELAREKETGWWILPTADRQGNITWRGR
jgi:hypothetical protein